MTYFSGLNYTLGNEDTTLEGEMVSKLMPKHVLSVCGSGGRSLPLGRCSSKTLTCVDLSQPQLHLAKLRERTYRDLDYQSFLRFWGYAPYTELKDARFRKETFENLDLPEDVRKTFVPIFEEIKWGGLLYLGKWESTFQTLAKVMDKIMGEGYEKLFDQYSLKDQKKYLDKDFSNLRWNAVLFLLGNKSVFNALLYKGEFIKKNVNDSHFAYYQKAFNNLFKNNVARESFFANLCFFGRIIHPDGNPYEAYESTHSELKEALQEGLNVKYGQWNIMDAPKHAPEGGYDFLSISDVPSYFSGSLERTFLQDLSPALAKDSVVVIRYYLKVLDPDTKGFEDVTNQYKDLIKKEKVQMYRIKVYKKVD